MNPQEQFCPNEACPARGQVEEGNIGVHNYKDTSVMYARKPLRKDEERCFMDCAQMRAS